MARSLGIFETMARLVARPQLSQNPSSPTVPPLQSGC